MSKDVLRGPLASLSIRAQIIASICGLVLVIVLFQVAYFPRSYRERATAGLHQKAESILKLIGYTVAPSLEFDDRQHASEILTGASQDADLLYVALYTKDSTLFARWSGEQMQAPETYGWTAVPTASMTDDVLTVTMPLTSKNGVQASLKAAFSAAGIRAEARDNLVATLLIATITLALGAVLAQLQGTRIRTRIGTIVSVAQKVAAGNLKEGLLGDSQRDEIGMLSAAFNDMITSQQFLVRQIATTARQIAATSSEMVSSARQQEQGATEQSTAVEETRRTMESLLQSGRQIAQSAQLVLQNAEKTQTNNQLISERISALSAHTQRISEILEVIKDIANKSDLLALNAALEGTKAGEAGRGFSLVASQMQRLAENVMGAVRDIKGLTGDVREATNSSVLATEDGTKLAADTTRSARQISLIMQQQQTGTEQVSRAMDDVSQIAQQTAAGSKQALNMTRELTDLAEQLDELVNRFELSDG